MGIWKQEGQVAGAVVQKYGIGAGWMAWQGLDVYLGYAGNRYSMLIVSSGLLPPALFFYFKTTLSAIYP